MRSLAVLLMIVFSVAAAVPVARAWRTRSARLVALGVAAFGCLVVGFHILGILAALTDAPLVTAPAALLVCAALCVLAWAAGRQAPVQRPPATGGVARDGARCARPRASASGRRRWIVPALAAAVAGAFLGAAVVSGLSAPPRNWDVLAYHLPRTLGWLRHGDLGVHGSTGAFYPGNGGLPILTLLMSGSDRLVPIVQLPFTLLAGAALFGLARELGCTARSSALAALVLLTAPIVFFHSTIAKDDVIVTAMVLAGVLFLVRSLRADLVSRIRLREVAASGFALGLALGTKYSILPFVAAVVPLLLVLHAARVGGDAEEPRARSVAAVVGVFLLAIAVPSAFWFLRNAIVAGNPVAPLSLNVGEWIASPSIDKELQFVAAPSRWWFFPWTDRQLVAGYNGSAGYGAAFAVFFVPGLALAVRGAASRRLPPHARAGLAAVLLSIALAVTGWWFGRYHLPRLLLPAVGLACVPIALVFDAVTWRGRAALLVLFALAVAFSGVETLRVVFAGRDITWTYRGGVGRREFYRMPDLIYELPVGTRILLLRPSSDAYFETYRYPLVGDLPGNDVVMEDDVGIETRLGEWGARVGHAALVDRGIEYLFMRTLGIKRYTTWFDEHPDLYEQVLDTAEPGYPWYRESYAVSETGEVLGRSIVMTKVYRVLPR